LRMGGALRQKKGAHRRTFNTEIIDG
jgi:hypothetical protein